MKYITLIGDGMADHPIEALDGMTPLEYAKTPNADFLSSKGETGLLKIIPDGIAPGTDTAFYGIMGYDVTTEFTGRSPLEASGMGIDLPDGSVSFRCNLAAISEEPYNEAVMVSHSGGQIPANDGAELMRYLTSDAEFAALLQELGINIYIGTGFRHIAAAQGAFADVLKAEQPPMPHPHDIPGQRIMPQLDALEGSGATLKRLMLKSYEILSRHDINIKRRAAGLPPANCIWLWGQGTKPNLRSFEQKFGVKGAVVTAVPLVSGIGALAGLKDIEVPGVTGEIDTNYDGKADAAIAALKSGFDYVLVHVEAPDECAHNGDMKEKIEAIELIDNMLGRMLESMKQTGMDFRLLYMPDHETLVSTRAHAPGPVPFAIYDSRGGAGSGLPFSEAAAKKGVYIPEGKTIMSRLFGVSGE
ncbi:MAG: 2,3-bisphosphoglycerate-independent phosphoglycerate mutase [Christensenellales bacterium]|jgi:2,3-bisphosphoglycerate-independent phosphoglycerate mutase